MTDHTHADLLAAVEKARSHGAYDPHHHWAIARNGHVADLAATLARHTPIRTDYDLDNDRCEFDGHYWPCSEALQAADRLTVWGVLGGDDA